MDNHHWWRPFNFADEMSPFNIVEGKANYLFDKNGNKYIDAYSGLWNVNLGYSDNDIKQAMIKQLEELPYINPITLYNEKSTQLSEMICDITHEDIGKVIYTCTGSEAVEVSIKIARQFSNLVGKKKYHIAIISNSYHGSYYGSMSASNYDEEEKDGYGPMLDGFIELPLPFCRCCQTEKMSEDCKQKILKRLSAQLEKNNDQLCAVLIEPVLASGGIIELFPEYLRILEQFCKDNEALFICDEVATGFGRTGTMFRFQKFNLRPDIITMSKGINNGYLPLGAVGIAKKIEDVFSEQHRILYHLSTQNANPICLAGAIATINKYKDQNILSSINTKSRAFGEILSQELLGLSNVFEIRKVGLMIAIDLVDSNTREPINQKLLMKTISTIFSSGCFAGVTYTENISSSILMFPQYIIEEGDMQKITNIIKSSLAVL